jgi:hypothetical protein
MPARYLVLGQVAPAGATITTLYTAPTGKDAVVSTLVVANRGTVGTSFRIVILPTLATPLEAQHYIAYDVAVAGGDSTTLTLGITLSPDNVIRVQGANSNLTFTAFGTEISF